MDAISRFLEEIRRSDYTTSQRMYNDISVYESVKSYDNRIMPLYIAAGVALAEMPKENYEILQCLVDEIESSYRSFERPSDELLSSIMHDYIQSNRQIRSLKEDYDYLCFVKECMNVQEYYLRIFKNKLSQHTGNHDEVITKLSVETEPKTNYEPIKGVRGLGEYLRIGITKAQDIINSNILQNNGIAYRVGRSWNINTQKLDQLLNDNPNILYKRNK